MPTFLFKEKYGFFSKKSKFVCAEAVKGEGFAEELRFDAGVILFAYRQLAPADEGHRIDFAVKQGRDCRCQVGTVTFALEGNVIATVVLNAPDSELA